MKTNFGLQFGPFQIWNAKIRVKIEANSLIRTHKPILVSNFGYRFWVVQIWLPIVTEGTWFSNAQYWTPIFNHEIVKTKFWKPDFPAPIIETNFQKHQFWETPISEKHQIDSTKKHQLPKAPIFGDQISDSNLESTL